MVALALPVAAPAAPNPARPAGDSPQTGSIVASGHVDCFPAGTLDAQGRIATCETSAVLFDGRDVYIANDKPTGRRELSAVFSLPYGPAFSAAPVRYSLEATIQAANKFEDFALSPDRKTVFLGTGFDRYDASRPDLDTYSTLLAWPVGAPEKVGVVERSERGGYASSVAIRERLVAALGGAAYFKIEGLAAIPGDRLLFGVREQGRRHDDFGYQFRLVEFPYAQDGGKIKVGAAGRVVYDQPEVGAGQVPQTLGLSSVEYDSYNDRLIALTSYELGGDRIGAYLWTLPMADFAAGKPPRLVRDRAGAPLHFAHKAEDVTVIDADTLLVIHDDDRVYTGPFERKPHEGYWDIVDLE
ncbi:MAG: hypothetical protein FJZ01_27080 [Candidatus Sericytochromatia bacterium]|nr:hypothetical protein [Candidatus Tanganyikabacteria bacterium]